MCILMFLNVLFKSSRDRRGRSPEFEMPSLQVPSHTRANEREEEEREELSTKGDLREWMNASN